MKDKTEKNELVGRLSCLIVLALALLVVLAMLVPSCQIVHQEEQLEMRRAFATKMGIDVPDGWGIATNQISSLTNVANKSCQ